jgi:hypothetical protein
MTHFRISVGLALAAAIFLGVFAELVRELRQHDPAYLAACADVELPPVAWTCRQILQHDSLNPTQVADLNRGGGVMHAISIRNLPLAEEVLSLFIANGVDVNARGDIPSGGLTVLHVMVRDSDLARARLLLKYGARANIPDAHGETAMSLATRLRERNPDQPTRAAIERMLRDAVENQ